MKEIMRTPPKSHLDDDHDDQCTSKKQPKDQPDTPTTVATTSDDDEDDNICLDEKDKDFKTILPNNTTDDDTTGDSLSSNSCSFKWNAAIRRMHRVVVLRFVQAISSVAAKNPKITLILLALLSVGVLAAGLFTNFTVETQTHLLWPPKSSLSVDHSDWLYDSSHFNNNPVELSVLVHASGSNVLGKSGVRRVFDVIDTITTMQGYKEGCAWADLFGDLYWVGQCSIYSVADHWNESAVLFETTVQSDEDAIIALSNPTYPTGILVDVKEVMGNTVYGDDYEYEFIMNFGENSSTLDTVQTLLFESAQSYLVTFGIPWSNVTLEFETAALREMLALQQQWENEIDNGIAFRLEVTSYSSYEDEFMRAIVEDLYLLPIAFALVAAFTVFFAFGKCDKVHSRGLLGIGAVLTIVGSIMASFGLLFACGVPFTTQTLMLPFLMFGIGLDDAFIIYGSYHRNVDNKRDPIERIRSTMDDIGVSIFLTSLTSMLAFVLGSFSRIPAVRWLCLYAFPCIGIDFLYQITFFVALIVLDERRIQDNRCDYITCIRVKPNQQQLQSRVPQQQEQQQSQQVMTDHPVEDEDSTSSTNEHAADRIMGWFAVQILKGWVQCLALVTFAGLTAGSIYCATQLEQQFDFTSLVPQDSYLKGYYSSLDDYTERGGVVSHTYFRDVDQSSPDVQWHMEAYIDALVQDGDVDQPVYFWVWDFNKYVASRAQEDGNFTNLTFAEQMDAFLSEPIYRELYKEDIGRDHSGEVWETRCKIHINVDRTSSKAVTEMLANLREISSSQPINQGLDDLMFFTYTNRYHIYEFYRVVVEELTFTTIMGVLAVNVVAFFFIPHWSAVFFTLPFISILYVNMLGWMYLSGVQINAISYVTLVMSIGLMVDYIMHILMRYYESKGTRRQRVQATMSSMGSSIFLGAASTVLGLLVLAFSTSDILQNVFVSVVGLIGFGVLAGLVFLPVVLSLVGPE